MNTQIQLSPIALIFVDVGDGTHPVSLSTTNIAALETHIANELSAKFGKKIRTRKEGEYAFPNSGVVESQIHRVPRNPALFPAAFVEEVKTIVQELSKAEPGDGVLVVDAHARDEPGFERENLFSDYVYVFARLVKKNA